eukprot:9682500-Ditylum_brightwellii.AAC.1
MDRQKEQQHDSEESASDYLSRCIALTQEEVAPKKFQEYLQRINCWQQLFDSMCSTPSWVTVKKSIVKEEEADIGFQYVAPTETIN